jgi:ATP-dependent Clp protease protease subunit
MIHTKQRLNEILAANTGQPYEKIERDTDRDYIMGPEEAMEYGVIDRVVDRIAEGLASQPGGFSAS